MKAFLVLLLSLLLLACETVGPAGPQGEQGPQGLRGETGPVGPPGDFPPSYVRRAELLAEVGGAYSILAECDEGDFAVGGGCEWPSESATISTIPVVDGDGPPFGWLCTARGVGVESFLRAHAVCVAGGGDGP